MMTNQEYKDQIYLALIKLLQNPDKSQAEINRDADRMVTCMKLDRLNAEELNLVLDWYKNPTEQNSIMSDPFKFRIVNDFIKKYPNIITGDDPCNFMSAKDLAIKKLNESRQILDDSPPNTGGINSGNVSIGKASSMKSQIPTPTPTKSKVPIVPIAIGVGLIAIIGVIILKKSK